MTQTLPPVQAHSPALRRGTILIILLVCPCLQAHDKVETVDGAVYKGKILDESLGAIVLETPDGTLVIPEARIERVERGVDISEDTEDENGDWLTRIEFGALVRDGTETEGSMRTAIAASRGTEAMRTRLEASHFYMKSTGANDENRTRADGLQEWLNPESKWSRFISGTYDYDDLREWKQRASMAYGVGYDFRNEEEFKLIGRGGAGFLKEFSGERSLDAEGDLALELEWGRSDVHRVFVQNVFLPNLSDFGQYRNESRVSWFIELSRGTNIFLTFNLENEYESRTTEDDPHNDLRLSTSLVFEF